MARTIKLSDIQFILLSTASQRSDGSLPPWPRSLADHGGEVQKAMRSMIKRGLVVETETANPKRHWREAAGRLIGASITDAGREAVTVEGQQVVSPPDLKDATGDAPEALEGSADRISPDLGRDYPEQKPPVRVTKRALVISLLRRGEGASIVELVDATGWLPHTTRAALTGLRKKGHAIAAEKVEGATRYRIGGVA